MATEHDIRHPPNIKPVRLKFGMREPHRIMEYHTVVNGGNEIVFTKDNTTKQEQETKEATTTTNNSASPSHELEDEEQ